MYRFNQAQEAAVRWNDGPCMVIAGPGSGKTFVITQRLKRLIEEAGVRPERLLTITFTKIAAREMQARFCTLTDGRFPGANFGTFHAVFYQILRQSPQGRSRAVITDTEKRGLLRHILKGMGLAADERDLTGALSRISCLKNDGVDAESGDLGVPFRERFTEIYDAYQRHLRELRKMDFDDMLRDCLRLLREDSAVRAAWQARFSHLLVDEYQDVNRVQFEMLRILCAGHENLFVVGDDDQSIYSFRGAKPELMLRFREFYPAAKVIALDVNYRSRQAIIDLSARLIGENRDRFPKRIRAAFQELPGEICAGTYESVDAQYGAMASYLTAHPKELRRTAFLFRANREAARMSEHLMRAGIPFSLREALKCLYDTPEALDVAAYLAFSTGVKRRRELLRIMNRPMRYIGRSAAAGERVSERELLAYYRNEPLMQETVRRFFRDCSRIGELQPKLAVRYLRTVTGYEAYLLDGRTADARERITETLDRIQEAAGAFADTAAFLRYMETCRRETAAKNREMERQRGTQRESGVCLMTLHAAKGLEYHTVWLPDLNEGILPGRRAHTQAQIEEERRMLYVGMTRAKERLILSYVRGYDGSMRPSRFLTGLGCVWATDAIFSQE